MGRVALGRSADPTSLGSDFWKLWGSSAVSTFGDGVYFIAFMLLGASLTSDPVLLSTISIASTLPWLLFALPSGVLVDRLDRRRVMWITDAIRFAIVAVFAAIAATGHATILLLTAVAFLLATGETLYGTAAQSIVPQIVSNAPDRLQRANSRLTSVQIVVRDFVGKPLGGALFGAIFWLPLALNALSFGLAAALIARLNYQAEPAGQNQGLVAEVREGMKWLWRHRLLRTLAIAVCVGNFAFMLWGAVLVLVLVDRLALEGLWYGVMMACLGIGGILGSVGCVRISQRFGMAAVMIGAMLIEATATLVLGAAFSPALAAAMLVLVGAAAVSWNVITVSLRQSIVPIGLQGRVNGAYRLLAAAGAPAGAACGGVIASSFGLTTPFFVSSLLTATVAIVAAATAVHRKGIDEAQAAAGVNASDSSPPTQQHTTERKSHEHR